jgi:hypothetical protein
LLSIPRPSTIVQTIAFPRANRGLSHHFSQFKIGTGLASTTAGGLTSAVSVADRFLQNRETLP